MRMPTIVKSLFERPRPVGDFAFSVGFLLFALLLASKLGTETTWVKRTKLFAQPAFWPTVGIFGMLAFAAVQVFGAMISKRSVGRFGETLVWARSIEFAIWFMAYVLLTPKLGYLPTTLAFTLALTIRAGFRGRVYFVAALGVGFFIVVVFKSFLQVKIPGGAIYDFLPDALRNFMILNF